MPPAVEGTTDESDAWAMSPCFPTRLHAQAGAILGLHPRLHAGARPAAGRSRFATILPGDAAFSPPDGAHARTQRPDPPSARHRSEHQGVGRSRSTAALTRQLRSTRQILCAELLVAYFENDYIVLVPVDRLVGERPRALMFDRPPQLKPPD